MAVYEIPLIGEEEVFDIEINNVEYRFRVLYNEQLEQWTVDLGKPDGTWLILNLALVAGQNLLSQYEHLQLGFALYMQVDGKPDGEATKTTLGNPARLLALISDE